jgi:hypothetical protein
MTGRKMRKDMRAQFQFGKIRSRCMCREIEEICPLHRIRAAQFSENLRNDFPSLCAAG